MFNIGTIFPYSDLHQLNLDWILQKVSQLDDFEQKINDYIDKTLPGVIQTEVNKKIISFAVNTYYDSSNHSLVFYPYEKKTEIETSVHSIQNNTLTIIQKEV